MRDAEATLVKELTEEGFLRPDEAVRVQAMHQKSLSYRVSTRSGTNLFVKQATMGARGTWTADIAREARVLRYVASDQELSKFSTSFAGSVERGATYTVVSGWIEGAVPLTETRRKAAWDPTVLASLGRRLAILHSHSPLPGHGLAQVDHLVTVKQNWDALTPTSVSMFGSAYAEMSVRIRAGGLIERVDSLALRWRPACLIHGDLKSDNILCTQSEQFLIDWEVGGIGDPRWDVGSILGDALAAWVGSMDLKGPGGLPSWIKSAVPQIDCLRDELRALLQAYESVSSLAPSDLVDVLGYAAVFLLQRVCSSAMYGNELSATALALLQLASTLLNNPDQAVKVLL